MTQTGGSSSITVSFASRLVTGSHPAALLRTTTVKIVPSSARLTGPAVMRDAVAPGMLTPLRRHWKVGAGLPVASTENVAVAPSGTVLSSGCTEIRAQLLAPVIWNTRLPPFSTYHIEPSGATVMSEGRSRPVAKPTALAEPAGRRRMLHAHRAMKKELPKNCDGK